MAMHRNALPQLKGGTFLTDGGLETTLVFHQGIDLPFFASFPLATSEMGRDALRKYFRPYLELAKRQGVGFILDTPTWRASSDWGEKLGYSAETLKAANQRAIGLLVELRDAYAKDVSPIVICGAIGPRGDGYKVEARMSAEEAERYHSAQVEAFSETEADMVGAYTLNYVDEAIGVARAARRYNMPLALSFTVETDGKLPSGETLRQAVETVDRVTNQSPMYYMINCAHPTHFAEALSKGPWLDRIRGIRANSSTKSHAELDAATELDVGDPQDLGRRYRELRGKLNKIVILGGCCGTDHRHLAAISDACLHA